MRAGAQLIDAASAAIGWAGHFDGTMAEIFDLPDLVAKAVAEDT